MKRLPGLLLVIGLIALGCGKAPEPIPPSTPPEELTEVQPAEDEVRVDIMSWQDVQQLISDASGKVVVVDLWSTWCAPCRKEFPRLVQLHERFPNRLVCLSVNLDYIGLADEPPEASRDKVLEFLTDNQATFQNIISSDPDEDVMNQLGLGAVPVVLVYGPDGQLAKVFHNEDSEYGDEGFTYDEHVAPLVEDLFSESS